MKQKNTIDYDKQRITVSIRVPRYLKEYCDAAGISISNIVENEIIKIYVDDTLKPKRFKKAIK